MGPYGSTAGDEGDKSWEGRIEARCGKGGAGRLDSG